MPNNCTDLDAFDAIHDDPIAYEVLKDRVLRGKRPMAHDGGEAKVGSGIHGTTIHRCDSSLGGSQYRYS